MGLKGFLKTVALGAGVMYFLDPELGEQRRMHVNEQMQTWQRDMEDLWVSGTRDLQDRLQGVQSQVRSSVSEAGSGNASELLSRIEARQEMAPGTRLLSLGGGGLLALYGVLRGGISGKIVTLAGLNYLARGLANKGLVEMIPAGRKGTAFARPDAYADTFVEDLATLQGARLQD